MYSSKSHLTVSIITKNTISKPGDSDNILWFLHGAVVWHHHLRYLGFPTHAALSYLRYHHHPCIFHYLYLWFSLWAYETIYAVSFCGFLWGNVPQLRDIKHMTCKTFLYCAHNREDIHNNIFFCISRAAQRTIRVGSIYRVKYLVAISLNQRPASEF